MSLATVEMLKESWESDINLRYAIKNSFHISGDKFNVEQVERFLQQQLQYQLEHRLGKGVRPWDLVNMTKRLDPKQPWIGIEYETGYSNRAVYEKVINYVWQQFPLTAVDAEGCGAFPCEITFAPVNFDEFVGNDVHMDKLLTFMKKQDCPKASHRGMIGTHCNISTPAYRGLSKKIAEGGGYRYKVLGHPEHRVVSLLNQGLHQMTADEKRALFGRLPYGTFYARSNAYGTWIEGKLFNSTSDIDKWRGYKEVIAKLCEVVEFLSKKEAKGQLFTYIENDKLTNNVKMDYSYYGPPKFKYVGLNNLADVLMGKEKVSKLDISSAAGNRRKSLDAADNDF